MRRLVFLVVVALVALGCAAKKAEPVLTPGSRLIFHNGTEALWSICDRGARVYLTQAGTATVIPNACPTGEP